GDAVVIIDREARATRDRPEIVRRRSDCTWKHHRDPSADFDFGDGGFESERRHRLYDANDWRRKRGRAKRREVPPSDRRSADHHRRSDPCRRRIANQEIVTPTSDDVPVAAGRIDVFVFLGDVDRSEDASHAIRTAGGNDDAIAPIAREIADVVHVEYALLPPAARRPPPTHSYAVEVQRVLRVTVNLDV